MEFEIQWNWLQYLKECKLEFNLLEGLLVGGVDLSGDAVVVVGELTDELLLGDEGIFCTLNSNGAHLSALFKLGDTVLIDDHDFTLGADHGVPHDVAGAVAVARRSPQIVESALQEVSSNTNS